MWLSPAAALNDWICPGPPTAFHRLVAAELSLSSIIRCASDRSGGADAEPSRCCA